MKHWPVAQTQPSMRAARFAVLLASVIIALLATDYLGWGILGALAIVAIVAPAAYLLFNRFTFER